MMGFGRYIELNIKLRARTVLELSILIIFFESIPDSNFGPASIRLWQDQSFYFQALQDVSESSTSQIIEDGTVGPGYIALASIISSFINDKAMSLIFLNKFSIYTVIGIIYFKFRSKMSLVMASGLMILLLLFTDLLFLAEIPWSHFTWIAIFMLILESLRASRSNNMKALIVGSGLTLLWQVRMYETAIVIIVAFAIITARYVYIRSMGYAFKIIQTSSVISQLLVFSISIIITLKLIDIRTGKFGPWVQYAGSDIPIEMSPMSLGKKFVQVFLAPNYLALDGTIEEVTYLWPERLLNPSSFGRWFAPFGQQQPMLIPILLTSIYLLFAFLKCKLQRKRSNISYYSVMIISISLGISLVYLLNPVMGSGHLRYGIMREYMAPQLMIVYIFSSESIVKSFAKEIRIKITLLLFMIFSLSLPLIQAGFPDETYSNYSFAIQKVKDASLKAEYIVDIKLYRKSGNPQIYDGFFEYQYECLGKIKTGFAKQSVELDRCMGEMNMSVLPSIFGISVTPEGADVLEDKRQIIPSDPDSIN